MADPVTRINMISGPRNISTAMMYSFRSRPDTTVFDEPLYAHYLRVTGIDHPGRDVTMATLPRNGTDAVSNIILGDCATPVLFIKNMAHHIVDVGLDLGWLDVVENFFLIRNPAEVLKSLTKNLPNPTPEMTGLPQQAALVQLLASGGKAPIVMSSRQILEDPARQLESLCKRLGIDWDSAMLAWEPGPKPEDGTWAQYWYARLHETTGFEPYRPSDGEVPEHLQGVLAECQVAYDNLAKYLDPST